MQHQRLRAESVLIGELERRGDRELGCGVFGGDAELKSVIQWLVCSRVGRTMNYFPHDNGGVFRRLPQVSETLISRGVAVG